MSTALFLAALLFLAAPSRGEENVTDPQTSPDASTVQAKDAASTPPLDVKLTNEDSELGLRPQWNPWPGFTFTPALRAGAIAVGSTLENPYSVLLPSPFVALDLKGIYSGPVEAMVIGTDALVQLNSQKLFNDPTGGAGSPASTSPTQNRYSQNQNAYSLYGDFGKIIEFSPAVRAAVFAAANQWQIGTPGLDNALGLTEANAGAALMVKDSDDRYTLLGDVNGTLGRNDFTSNYTAPGNYYGGTERFEYARRLSGANWGLVGLETTQSTADDGYRPYVGWENGGAKAMLAGNFRHSNYYAYPDVNGLGVDFRTNVTPAVSITANAALNNEMYQGAPGPEMAGSAMFGVRIELDHKAVVESAMLVQRYQQENYQPAASYSMMSRLANANYAATFRQALQDSPTMAQFVKNIGANGTDPILAALSAFSLSLSQHNYNYNESASNMNSNNMESIYEAARSAYLNNSQDPVLVCLGEAEFTATLAEAMGAQAGVPIRASGVTVAVPVNGNAAGHAVAFVQTPQYGYVIIDWGQLTPTNTFNTKTALAIYQGLVGIPLVYSEITNPDKGGSHVGYLFSDDGKMMVKNLTYHAESPTGELNQMFQDDPHGDQITVERYTELLKNKPSQQ